MKLIPHAQIQMLGVTLGNDVFVSDFVESKLLGRLQHTVNKLVDFEDTQAATYVLRVGDLDFTPHTSPWGTWGRDLGDTMPAVFHYCCSFCAKMAKILC